MSEAYWKKTVALVPNEYTLTTPSSQYERGRKTKVFDNKNNMSAPEQPSTNHGTQNKIAAPANPYAHQLDNAYAHKK